MVKTIPKNQKKKKPITKLDSIAASLSVLAEDIKVLKNKRAIQEPVTIYRSRKDDLIPRPKGTPGRAPPKGYNLQDEMGLQDNKRRYNRIASMCRELASRHLDVSKTMNQQDKLVVCQIIAKAQRKIKFLRKFSDGWPIRDVISRFLRNHAALGRLKQKEASDCSEDESRSEEESNASDSDDVNEDSDEEASDKVKRAQKASKHSNHRTSQVTAKVTSRPKKMPTSNAHGVKQTSAKRKRTDDDDDDNNHNIARKGERKKAKAKTIPPTKMVIKKPQPQCNKGKIAKMMNDVKKQRAAAVSSRKQPAESIKDIFTDDDDDLPVQIVPLPKKRAYAIVMSDEADDEDEDNEEDTKEGEENNDIDLTAAIHIPTACPADHCQDRFPKHPSQNLIRCLKVYQDSMKLGKMTFDGMRAELNLCMELSAEIKKPDYAKLAEIKGWPQNISFIGVPDRVMAMRDDLKSFVFNAKVRRINPLYKLITRGLERAGISKNFKELTGARMVFGGKAVDDARPGYYGEKGNLIIQSTLCRIFDINNIKTKSIAPLSLSSFSTYFLVPYIACCLIREDLDCSVEYAYNTMIESGDAGYGLNPEDDDDDELDSIQRKNLRLAKIAREMRSNGQEELAETVGASTSSTGLRPRPRPRYVQFRD